MTTNKKECWGDRPECWSKTGVAFYCEVTDSVNKGTINIQRVILASQAIMFFFVCMLSILELITVSYILPHL